MGTNTGLPLRGTIIGTIPLTGAWDSMGPLYGDFHLHH